MKNKRSRLTYFIPIIGRIRLIKRIERLERRLDEYADLTGEPFNTPLIEFYESRIQNIYDKLLWMLENKKIHF